MRGLQLAAPKPVGERPLSLVELPVPRPGPGEVLLRVRACGVCRTDLHIVEGELPPHRSPVVPGHQIVGEVAALGAGAERLPPGGDPSAPPLRSGERVGVPWLHRTCGRCRFCRSGRENLCENAQFTGWDVDGGFSEYMVAPADFVYRLPDAMDDLAVAPLLCAGIIGYRCLRLVGIVGDGAGLPGAEAADQSTADAGNVLAGYADGSGRTADAATAGVEPRRLGLYGFGSAAHLCTQVARWRGWEVYAFTRGAEHRSLALELGAAWAGEASEDPGVLLDAAIIFAPAGELAIDALRRTDRGGIVALGGIYSSPIPPIEYPWIYDERVVRSIANSTRQDARELLRDAALVPVRSRVEEYDLEQANEALIDLKQDRVRGSAVLRVG
ncbi:MAG: zinc-dependent alcohol dehydrogenase family protein [Thermoleophilia bacterium]|nr:zinc-dependent alcohol dehydrogenase family protein [Thermoleophilia bacterium]